MKEKIRYKHKDGTQESFTLNQQQQDELEAFIRLHFGRKAKAINTRWSSYDLKHMAQSMLGFYVSNADIKKTMLECGFRADIRDVESEINWHFNISKADFNRLIREKERYKWQK